MSVPPPGVHLGRRAPACRATLVSASLTTKYAAASTGAGSRSSSADLDGDGHRRAVGDLVHRGREPVVDQHPRVDATHGAAQVVERRLGLLGAPRARASRPGPRARRARRGPGHGESDQPLLDAVVQVALDPTTLGLEGVDQVDPRAAQVGDRRRQLLPRAGRAGAGRAPPARRRRSVTTYAASGERRRRPRPRREPGLGGGVDPPAGELHRVDPAYSSGASSSTTGVVTREHQHDAVERTTASRPAGTA